jgi:hypothetical protein
MTIPLASLLLCVLVIAGAGCSRKPISVPVATNIVQPDDYIDLQPEWKLRIVVPLLKSGGFRTNLVPQQKAGNTITLSADDLIGYQVSHYAVKGRRTGGVRLEFVSAEATRDGKTNSEPRPPSLPFSLPQHNEHVRLVYLVRVSQADHNMAIVATKRLDALNTFTKRLKENPAICDEEEAIFCSWVPAGIAVRPEKP